MSQSGFIAAMLLAAFILWLAINDRLSTYAGVLFGNTSAPKPQGNLSIPGSAGGVEGVTDSPVGGSVPPAGSLSAPKTGGGGGFFDNLLKDFGLEEIAPVAEPLLLGAG